jgi:CHAT domain-containing protein
VSAEPPSSQREQLADEAARLNEQALALAGQGKVAEGFDLLQKSLALFRRAYPPDQFPDGHPELALSLGNQGFLLAGMGQHAEAVPFMEQSLAMYRKLYPADKYPSGHADIARALSSLGTVLGNLGRDHQALMHVRAAVDMRRQLYPRDRYPNGHPDLARGLNNLAVALRGVGRYDETLALLEEALAMLRSATRERFPSGHPDVALSLDNVAHVLLSLGRFQEALARQTEAVAMCRMLYPLEKYPAGHPQLALSLDTLGDILHSANQKEKALPFKREALDIRRRLFHPARFPDGHPDLAVSLSSYSHLLEVMGRYDDALPPQREALQMRLKLYSEMRFPDGHSNLAVSHACLGMLLSSLGQQDEALAQAEKARVMYQRLYPDVRYPDGHRDVAAATANVAALLVKMGRFSEALPHYERSLTLQRSLGRRLLLHAAEAEALAYAQARPATRDGYLSATTHVPDTATAAYRAVWDSKAAVTRVMELRHAAARASGAGTAERLVRLRETRRQTDRLLQESRLKPADRDRLLADLAAERDRLERELARDLPILERWKERDRQTTEDLAAALPTGTVFIDLIAYTRFEYNLSPKGPGEESLQPSYAAFVVVPAGPVVRVEFGAAGPIDAAIAAWRRAIDNRIEAAAAGELSRLLWQPLKERLPPRTRTLFLAPDGDLARLPWAALPTGTSRVLLEDYAVATVPHGPFLLQQLKHRPAEGGPTTILTLGDVAYGPGRWPALPGTAAEIGSIARLAPTAPVMLAKADATAGKLTELLPKARWAHLATHGELKADDLAEERRRLREAIERWEEGLAPNALRSAVKNPLGFTGLVLAGGEVLSGLSLIDLPLEGLQLVTLSACETGLGELTSGEGVYGLTRAFHLAGCPNVVASLWNVNDTATAALMAQFYHELWVNKKPPIEALREAQLTIYRHPERIADLAGERGRPALEAAAKLGSAATKPNEKPRTTPTKLWAAFVLSGVGR